MPWDHLPGDVPLGALRNVDTASAPVADADVAIVEDPSNPGEFVRGSVTAEGEGHAETVGDGSETVFEITHGLDTEDVVVQVWRIVSDYYA